MDMSSLETTNWLLVILLIFIFILGCAIQRVQDAVQSFHENWLNQENKIHHLDDDIKRDIKRNRGKD